MLSKRRLAVRIKLKAEHVDSELRQKVTTTIDFEKLWSHTTKYGWFVEQNLFCGSTKTYWKRLLLLMVHVMIWIQVIVIGVVIEGAAKKVDIFIL